jgi:sugar phosphate isomerase/epimerase
MYRNLNTEALGVSGRQSELIELALTYSYRGVDMNMSDLIKRVRSRGLDSVRRFIESANIRIGCFDLPDNWRGDDASYKSNLVELREISETAGSLNAGVCIATVSPTSKEQPYQECFEMHRSRLAEIAGILAENNVRMGLNILPTADQRPADQTPFIYQAETLMTLIKTIGHPNVGLALDTWSWYVGGGAMDQLSEMPGEQIVSVRLADVPADADLATIAPDQRLLPGDGGLIDSVAIIRHLSSVGFDGPVAIYPHASRFSGMTRDAIVQRASATLDEVFKEAGLNRVGKPLAATAEVESD